MTKKIIMINVKSLLISLVFLSTSAYADPYLSVGVGIHDRASDGPEFNMDREVGIFEAGYQVYNWDVRFTHISGLRTRESGYGANILSVNYRWYFR